MSIDNHGATGGRCIPSVESTMCLQIAAQKSPACNLVESAASGGYGLIIPLPAPLPTPQPAQLNYERSRKRGMFSPPSEEDLWSFFADNERRQRQRFLQDWGFDIRTDKPAVKVDGAADGSPWEWEEVEERSQKSTTIHAPCHELAVKRSTLPAKEEGHLLHTRGGNRSAPLAL
ncbi:hypothetical protein PPROV_000131200 [Pycnococcus provasolii]|uniref:Cyclin-dependent kinase inhibitor domain-containing protein n=1 Tax=Pycnococcus provasolii TaxID=41880 RepID=A0A830H5T5_9CHLO|nr:hypothetical protein PPROV_000131200 [Pycnococcus provasolii]